MVRLAISAGLIVAAMMIWYSYNIISEPKSLKELYLKTQNEQHCWGDISEVVDRYILIGQTEARARQVLSDAGFTQTWDRPTGNPPIQMIRAERLRSWSNVLSYFVAIQIADGKVASVVSDLKCASW